MLHSILNDFNDGLIHIHAYYNDWRDGTNWLLGLWMIEKEINGK